MILNSEWHVYSTQDDTLDDNGSFRFVPEDMSLVGVIRLEWNINWQ